MAKKKRVVIGVLGPTLDRGEGPKRWDTWRPTVSVCAKEDFEVDQFELVYQPQFHKLRDQVCADIATVSPGTNVVPHAIAMPDPWDFEMVFGALLDWARAYPFDTDKADYWVHITTGTHVVQICWFLLVESHFIPAKLLQSAPPKRQKREAELSIIDLDLSKYDKIASRFAAQVKEEVSFLKAGINTKNKRFNQLIERLEKIAVASKSPILLTGPTGVGKSQLARRVYELKKLRRQVEGEIVEVNCATLRGDAAMSALFGHVKGSFTGALQARSGHLKMADKGLLFLDEIGELGLDEQAMLLRAIEHKTFFPVGADKETSSDFQLIAGTNRNLHAAVQSGSFREDLLARINLWTFDLPPLRERPEDIEPNLEFEIARFSREQGLHLTFSREAHDAFVRYATQEADWPGNFRDFGAAIQRMGTLAQGGRVTLSDVRDEIASRKLVRAAANQQAHPSDVLASLLTPEALAAIDPFDRVQLSLVVETCKNSRTLSEAGRRLFAISRTTKSSQNDADRLRKYLARFELSWDAIVEMQS